LPTAFYAALVPLTSALLAAALIACAGVPRAAWGDLGRPADAVPFMEDVRVGVLPSGMRYFILENSMPADRALVRLVVSAGSLHEQDHEQGLAHFVEHMAFQGTERFPGTEVVDYLRGLGMRFGPDVNAFVSFDRTVYMIEVPVEIADNGTRVIPDMALAIIDQWSRAIDFNPENLETERLVVMDEYRMMLGAWDRIRQNWIPALLRGSRFAERMPIGQLSVLESAPREHLVGFFETWYQADNMALIFVGDFDGAALQASLEDHFHIQAPASATARQTFDLPPGGGHA
jgi:zinc protease